MNLIEISPLTEFRVGTNILKHSLIPVFFKNKGKPIVTQIILNIKYNIHSIQSPTQGVRKIQNFQ